MMKIAGVFSKSIPFHLEKGKRKQAQEIGFLSLQIYFLYIFSNYKCLLVWQHDNYNTTWVSMKWVDS